MGYGLGAAIGAQVANPGKQVINIAGDGCFRMNMNEIATAVRREAAVDRSDCEQSCARHGAAVAESVLRKTLFGDGFRRRRRLCEACGGDGGDRVSAPQPARQFNEAFAKAALAAKTPVVIDCVIGCDDKVWPMVAPGADISTAFTGEDLVAAQS